MGIGLALPVVGVVLTDMSALSARQGEALGIALKAALAAVLAPEDPSGAALATVDPDSKARVEVITGQIAPGDGSAESRFQAARGVDGASETDSVQVDVTLMARPPFSDRLGFGRYRVSASAVARRYGTVSITLPTPTEALDATMRNKVMSAVFDGSFQLTAEEYASLASARIPLAAIVRHIAATNSLSDASVLNVGKASLLPADIFSAMSSGLDVKDPAARALDKLASAAGPARPLRLVDLVETSLFDEVMVTDVDTHPLPVFAANDLLFAMTRWQTRGNTVHFELNKPETGLARLEFDLAVDDDPAIGPALTMTAAGGSAELPLITMAMTAKIAGSSLPGVTTFELPVYLKLFGGSAEVDRIECNMVDPTASHVHVKATPVRTSLAYYSVLENGDRDTAEGPALLVETSGLQAWIQGGSLIGDGPAASLEFEPGKPGSRSQSVASSLLFPELVERFLNSSEILVKSEATSQVPAGAARDDLAGLIADHARSIGRKSEQALAAFGVSPARIDVSLGPVNCANSRIEE